MALQEKMRAAVLRGFDKIMVEDVPMPILRAGTILLKVKACSICGSDIRIMSSGNKRVKFPAIIGHEMAGEVAAIGKNVKGFKIGDQLSIGADVPCGKCQYCKRGDGNCCGINYAMGYQFAGGFAQYCLLNEMVVKYGPICKIPKGVKMEEAALAEPLACCINGFERVCFSKGKSVLIIGAGPIGLLLLQTAKALGASLIVIADQDQARLKTSKRFAPDHMIHTEKNDLVKTALRLTQQEGFDAIFTACPSADAQEAAVKLLAKRGVLNFFGGLSADSRNINIFSNDIHYKEAYVTGSHGSTPRQHKMAVALIAKKKVKVADLITHRFSLENIVEAFDTSKKRIGLKVVVIP